LKQLLILSGKGGTGKTTIASGLIKLAEVKAYADCDVDAPNLHLSINQNTDPHVSDFYGLDLANINKETCILCGKCFDNCRFHAIKFDEYYEVDPYACEGCSVCEYICPVNAITMKERVIGVTKVYSNYHVFSTAQLRMGSGNSGLLVTEVKKGLAPYKNKCNLSIIDGSPGIGCPVIASISGVDMILVVAEPSLSGYHDMLRIIKTSHGFPSIVSVCVNKCDLNKKLTDDIINYCTENKIPFLGTLPFDERVLETINNGLTIADMDSPLKHDLEEILEKILNILDLKGDKNL